MCTLYKYIHILLQAFPISKEIKSDNTIHIWCWLFSPGSLMDNTANHELNHDKT